MIWHPAIRFGNLLDKKKNNDGSASLYFLHFSETSLANKSLAYGKELKLTFSCYFDFADYPFDLHLCPMDYGEVAYGIDGGVILETSNIISDGFSTETGQIVLDNLPFPYKFELKPLLTHENIIYMHRKRISSTGMILKVERNSFGLLLTNFYCPTATFALFSTVSFLIKPDKVTNSPNDYVLEVPHIT